MSDWRIYRGKDTLKNAFKQLPLPPWRDFRNKQKIRGSTFQPSQEEIDLVNAAFYLRRPLLVTGKPGSGKSSLAYAVAEALELGEVLKWSINSRSALLDGLYYYDSIARLRDANLEHLMRHNPSSETVEMGVMDIGKYIKLGPLGTALLPSDKPRILLIDEIDKSDIDLPNDLLHIFEDGEFEIPELVRIKDQSEHVRIMPSYGISDVDRVEIIGGKVQCTIFPFVLLTSNAERELSPAFFRRCLRLEIKEPDTIRLQQIVEAHLGTEDKELKRDLINEFIEKRKNGLMATDQLLNAIFLVTKGNLSDESERKQLTELIMKELSRV